MHHPSPILAEGGDDRREHPAHVHLDRLEHERVALDPGDDQEVVDDPDQSVGLREHDLQELVALGGDRASARRTSISTKPRIPASGVRSSWLVIATKSVFIASSSVSRWTIAVCSARRRVASSVTPSWSAIVCNASTRAAPAAPAPRSCNAPTTAPRSRIGTTRSSPAADRVPLHRRAGHRTRRGEQRFAEQVARVARDARYVEAVLTCCAGRPDEDAERVAAQLVRDARRGVPKDLGQVLGLCVRKHRGVERRDLSLRFGGLRRRPLGSCRLGGRLTRLRGRFFGRSA